MKKVIYLISTVILFSNCSKESFDTIEQNNSLEIYDEFWDHVNTNYIYFEEKNVDWDSIYSIYRSQINESTSEEELLTLVESSLKELKDGHNYVTSPIRKTYRYNFKAGYEIHFDLDLVTEKYMEDQITEDYDIFTYGKIDKEILYIHIKEMKYTRYIRNIYRNEIDAETKTIIFDLRNNGGGDSNPVPGFLGDFVTERTYLGSYIEKSGPDHDDNTAPIDAYAEPSEDFHFDGKVIVLTNRRSYSAASYMAAMCKGLPNFTIAGQITGGGGGGNTPYELSNGWIIGLSISDFLGKDRKTIEHGVSPDEFIENSEQDIRDGNDKMLEFAINLSESN